MDDRSHRKDIPLTNSELAYLQALAWETAHLEMNGPAHELAQANDFDALQLERLRRTLGNRRAVEVTERRPQPPTSWPWPDQSPESIIESLENRSNMSERSRLAYKDLAPESRSTMIETRRRYRLASMRTAGEPVTGPFYWMPLPDRGWELMVFADTFYGGHAEHDRVWKELVAIMALRWGKEPDKLAKQLNTFPKGLPRGRVAKAESCQWSITVGDIPNDAELEAVISSFNLPPGDTRALFDDSLCVIPEQAERVRNALGADYSIEDLCEGSDDA